MTELALSPQRAAYLRARKRRRNAVSFLQVFLLLSFLVLWEIAARAEWIDPFIFSCPTRVLETLTNLWRSGDLWLHLGTSCLETVVGFLLGTAIGTLAAAALWWSDFASAVLGPYLVVLNALPKTALGPIFIVWMGAGTASIITMTLAISVITTILSMHAGFLTVDPQQIRLMRTLGAGKGQIFCYLVFPANLHTLVSTLKVSVGLSWVGVIMGEFLVSRAGLGYLIVYGSQVFNMDLVMSTVLLLAIAAVMMYLAVLWLEKLLVKHLGVIP